MSIGENMKSLAMSWPVHDVCGRPLNDIFLVWNVLWKNFRRRQPNLFKIFVRKLIRLSFSPSYMNVARCLDVSFGGIIYAYRWTCVKCRLRISRSMEFYIYISTYWHEVSTMFWLLSLLMASDDVAEDLIVLTWKETWKGYVTCSTASRRIAISLSGAFFCRHGGNAPR